MRPIGGALLAFAFLIVAQLVVWRVRRAGHYTALSVLSLLALMLSVATFQALQTVTAGALRFLPQSAWDYWNFMMLYVALTLAYMITYSAVQADSPSMSILLLIEQAGARGVTATELMSTLNDQVLVVPRLNDLLVGRLALAESGRYTVTPSGSFLARIYIAYRALLKMEKGG
jgi:hypothetical protein